MIQNETPNQGVKKVTDEEQGKSTEEKNKCMPCRSIQFAVCTQQWLEQLRKKKWILGMVQMYLPYLLTMSIWA